MWDGRTIRTNKGGSYIGTEEKDKREGTVRVDSGIEVESGNPLLETSVNRNWY